METLTVRQCVEAKKKTKNIKLREEEEEKEEAVVAVAAADERKKKLKHQNEIEPDDVTYTHKQQHITTVCKSILNKNNFETNSIESLLFGPLFVHCD